MQLRLWEFLQRNDHVITFNTRFPFQKKKKDNEMCFWECDTGNVLVSRNKNKPYKFFKILWNFWIICRVFCYVIKGVSRRLLFWYSTSVLFWLIDYITRRMVFLVGLSGCWGYFWDFSFPFFFGSQIFVLRNYRICPRKKEPYHIFRNPQEFHQKALLSTQFQWINSPEFTCRKVVLW